MQCTKLKTKQKEERKTNQTGGTMLKLRNECSNVEREECNVADQGRRKQNRERERERERKLVKLINVENEN